jgi:uncharacterized membrane protein YeaQ/YmgE (transglycosylase-associated protein family)
MFDLLIVVIGAAVGFLFGRYLKGTRHGTGIDAAVGAIGGWAAVALSHVVGPAGTAGWVMSTIVAAIGAVVTLFVVRLAMISKTVPAIHSRRH